MRFATRTFLWSFIPFAVLLLTSFAAIQMLVQSTVRDRLRASLRDTHSSIARIRSKSELQNSRFLRVIGENPSLKAGLELLSSDPTSNIARLTLEDQLREICETVGFDSLMASDANGKPLAGVIRSGSEMAPMNLEQVHPPQRGFFSAGGKVFQVTSIPVNQGEENIGFLSLGEHFDFNEFSTPAALTHNRRVLQSSIPGIPLAEVQAAIQHCREQAECQVRLRNETYLSLPLDSVSFGEGYFLRSLQNIDSATGPVQSILRNAFLVATVAALLAALVISVVSSRSIVKPIAQVVSHLHETEQTGLLPEFDAMGTGIQEIEDLTASFNRAAAAIREARANLHRAYVEFIGTLASALDARDHYTAGHSRRVAEYSCAIARALGLPAALHESIRIGALLHDVGKIGIPDAVLQKPGRLTDEEVALIQQHPGIGRHILEGVRGFEAYLPIVELHHENWDGSGYPHGLRGEEVPIDARIVHIADAYDAMTSDRPYRNGMSHGQAMSILNQYAGTQFDPAILATMPSLETVAARCRDNAQNTTDSFQNLAQAILQNKVSAPDPVQETRS